jgi:hypothetical protein
MKALKHSNPKVTMNYLKIEVQSVGAAPCKHMGVFNMKRLLVLAPVLLSAMANAGQITLILSDEEETDNAKICVYSNVNYMETVTI